VWRRVWNIFEPLHRGIELLKCATTNPVFLLGIPPPTGDDRVSARCRGYLTKASTRIAAAKLFNDVNRGLSRHSGAIFIDLWERLAGSRGLKPEYTFDGVHLNGKAALIVLSELASNLRKVLLN
jgi:lysophospholipase L1-like esterase